MDQVDLMDLMDKMGAPCDTPWVCLFRCLGWLRVQIYRWVVLCLLDSNGGMRVAVARRLCQTCQTCQTCLTRWVRLDIPRGFACAAVWVGSECRFTVG